ncbi:rhomboid family intramembrane serine protease [Pontibacter vulgaris]|uniref:rhomboid family intramembrane serine protease n=1 Tax=Pontibacter vulgaris TaxID=2905679 RepID=UPI001FA80BF5|nr:rhomboid family intramembrane serine protease [Pontibacter vulgaris]
MQNPTHIAIDSSPRFAYSFLPGALFVALLWLISLMAYFTNADLTWLGVLPHRFVGLIGIFTGPLVHSGLMHLLSNSFPLLLLSGFILFLHRPVAVRVFVLVYFLSGILTWFIGRQSYHVGASGVVYGLAGYLLFNGLFSRNRAGLAVALAVLFLYAGLFQGLFPTEERISWEGHLGGMLAGLVAAISYSHETAKQRHHELHQTMSPEQHQSSTLGQHQSRYKVSYTIGYTASQKSQQHIYTLNAAKDLAHTSTTQAIVPSYTLTYKNKDDGKTEI